MQGVGIRNDGDRKSYLTPKPSILEIFPSWPMRYQLQIHTGNLLSARSNDSAAPQNTINQQELESSASMIASSEHNKQKQKQKQKQKEMMMSSDGSKAATVAPIHQAVAIQEKGRIAGSTRKDVKLLDPKTLRRLAQNREAARKSRMRKKAYVQQLESSRIRLQQLELNLQRARSQGVFPGGCNALGDTTSGAVMFDMEYARWMENNRKRLSELRGGLQTHLHDENLSLIVDECIAHYDELFRLKAAVARSDVFHLLTGMWITPAERCFLWMGGFKPSELLKMLMPQLDLLTEQQLMGICNLQQSLQQAEEALSQGLGQLRLLLAETVASGSPIHESTYAGNHMLIALGKLANLEGFVRQADNLRQQTLHQLRRLLTTRQAARCFLVIGEYFNHLRALSALWASRPRESFIANETACPTATDPQMVHQPQGSQFSAF
ncbi:transcription factor LG2-like isoform X2 [Ananas comosus]|nr:transcription factor LG2-like isoform X2 [Ananas comosus]XP_020085619.1 transcription factor LG2-like isoform X2 [Ananas comosus]